MTLTRYIISLTRLALLLGAGTLYLPVPPAPAQTVRIAAIGDSYASGEGAPALANAPGLSHRQQNELARSAVSGAARLP